MAARIARNNRDTDAVWLGLLVDWNGNTIPAGAIVVVDDESPRIIGAAAAGVIELDPVLGRHLRWRDKPEAPTP